MSPTTEAQLARLPSSTAHSSRPDSRQGSGNRVTHDLHEPPMSLQQRGKTCNLPWKPGTALTLVCRGIGAPGGRAESEGAEAVRPPDYSWTQLGAGSHKGAQMLESSPEYCG